MKKDRPSPLEIAIIEWAFVAVLGLTILGGVWVVGWILNLWGHS